jgi:hypothetical protein
MALLRLKPEAYAAGGGGEPSTASKADVLLDEAQAVTRIGAMIYFIVKALLSGVIVAAASETARRYPGFGGLIASLPLVSVLGMIWLWRDTHDAERMAAHATATFWFVLPSLPMFLLIPMLLRRNVNFWAALTSGCVLTILLYFAVIWLAPRLGLRLR